MLPGMNADQIENLVSDLMRTFAAGTPPRTLVRSLIRNAMSVARQAARGAKDGHMNIEVRPIVSGTDYRPVVQVEWGEKQGQLSPGEARDFAERLRLTADAAESDAFVFEFLTQKIGTDAERAATVLYQFRQFREKRARLDYDLRPAAADDPSALRTPEGGPQPPQGDADQPS